MKNNFLLRLKGISKLFPGVKALDNVDFVLNSGEIHALVGENGAGKTTLMNIASGNCIMDSGDIFINSEKANITNPRMAQHLGIAIVHQELNLIPIVTAAENIFIGREPYSKYTNFINNKTLNKKTEELLELFGLEISPKCRIMNLNPSEQQIVEIAKALSLNAKILILDEPTSSLEEKEVIKLFNILRNLAKNGIGIVYISHRLKEVFAIADRITVLRDGRVTGEKLAKDSTPEEVISMMVGRKIGEFYPEKQSNRGEEILEIKNFNRKKVFKDINFSLFRKEILGFAGLLGSGRSELMQSIFGHIKSNFGKILVNGREVKVKNSADSIRHGIVYLPEDRKSSGLFTSMNLVENLISSNLSSFSKYGFLDDNRAKRECELFIELLNIRCRSTLQKVETLSGGNQQRVLLAKWLQIKPKILIADEPTRGIDVGSKVQIYNILRRLAEEGMGIILISSELPEIISMSDRVIVMHEGRIAGELSSTDATEEKIMILAAGQS